MACLSPSVFSEKEVRARKDHVCCECGKTMQRGDQYIVSKGLWDGIWSTFKTCVWCVTLKQIAVTKSNAYGDDGPAFGELHSWLQG